MGEIDRPRDPMQEFKEKLIAQVRDNIRDLLPQEAVQKLIDEAVRQTFFESRPISNPNRPYNPIVKPSWFVEAVAKEATPILEMAVKAYVAENKPIIDQALKEFLSGQNLTLLAVGGLAEQLREEMNMANYNLMQIMRGGR